MILYAPQSSAAQAQLLASSLNLTLNTEHHTAKQLKAEPTVSLWFERELWLVGHGFKVKGSWSKLAKRVVSAGRATEPLLKAVKINPNMKVIDATAGFGVDALLMAGRGTKVCMIESNPLLWALLKHELSSIKADPNWASVWPKLELIHADSAQTLPGLNADLVYLDPMFPEHSMNAKVKAPMQLLQTLCAPPTYQQELSLLSAAQAAAPKVVVKRPKHAPHLAALAPAVSQHFESVRFDTYYSDQKLA